MSGFEIPLPRVARFEEQYSRTGDHTHRSSRNDREGFNVLRGQLDDKTAVFVATPPNEALHVGAESRLALTTVHPDVIELTIEKPLDIFVAAALAQTAFSEIARQKRTVNVIARVPFDLENSEKNLDTAEIFVDTFDMEVGGITRDGEIIYLGDSTTITTMATAALRRRAKNPLTRA